MFFSREGGWNSNICEWPVRLFWPPLWAKALTDIRPVRKMKRTTVISGVYTFIRASLRWAVISLLAARLNGALVGSTCHMGGSRGGWGYGGGGGRGRKESCSFRLTFLQYPYPSSPTPPFFFSPTSPQRGALRNKVRIETSLDSFCL